jgi:hypothetical protein
MDDSVIGATQSKTPYSKLAAVTLKCLHLLASHRIVNAVTAVRLRIMVRHGNHTLGAQHAATLVTYGIKSLRGGNLMAVQTVYVKLCRTVRYGMYHMRIPYLVK